MTYISWSSDFSLFIFCSEKHFSFIGKARFRRAGELRDPATALIYPYFTVQWFCLISWRLFDVWTSYFGIMSQYDLTCVWPQNKCRSLWPIFHDPVILPFLFFALKNILVLLAKPDSGELCGPATALICLLVCSFSVCSSVCSHPSVFIVSGLLTSQLDELVKASNNESVANYIQHALAFLMFNWQFDGVFVNAVDDGAILENANSLYFWQPATYFTCYILDWSQVNTGKLLWSQ